MAAMIKDTLEDLVRAHLGPVQQTRKGWSSRNCMMCHHHGESTDRRGRFGIIFSPDGGIATSCFNCSHKSKFVPGETFSKEFSLFLQEIGIPHNTVKLLNFELYKEHYGKDAVHELQIAENISAKWVPATLPSKALTMQEWADAGCTDKSFLNVLRYAYNRGIRNFSQFYWTPQPNGMLNKRLIVPFTYRDNIVGFTGRFAGTPPDKKITKYYNISPSDFIYNLDRQKPHNDYIILCEGVLDAYHTNGISTQGNEINESQVAYIKSLNKTVIVLPDFDKDGSALVNLAVKHNWAVSFPFWSHEVKDAASAVEKYGRVVTMLSILDAVDYSTFSAQVKWRMKY